MFMFITNKNIAMNYQSHITGDISPEDLFNMFFGGGGGFTTFSMGGGSRDPFASKYCW